MLALPFSSGSKQKEGGENERAAQDGSNIGNANEADALQDAINGKIEIEIVDKFTEAEKEVMRHMQAVGYRYIVRDFSVIVFSTGKPQRNGVSWNGLGRSALATEDISAQFPAITDKSDPVSIEEALA